MINKINTVSLDKMNSSSTLKHIMSVEKANEEAKKSPASKMQKALFPALIGTVAIANTALTKGPTATKLGAGALTLLSYAILNKSFNTARAVTNKILPEDKQNPLISTAGTIGGGIALYELATKGIVNGAYLVKTKFPKINKGIAKLADKVNNSSIINKPLSYIEKGAKSIATKFPKTANFIAKNYFAIGLGAFIAGTVLFNKKINNTKEQVYMETMNKLNNNENIEDLC